VCGCARELEQVGVVSCCGKANAFPQRARATEKGKAVGIVVGETTTETSNMKGGLGWMAKT
jgi:hypothetical protein